MCIIPAPVDHADGGITALVLGAAANLGVLDFIGNDVAAFCDDLMKDSRTYADTYQESSATNSVSARSSTIRPEARSSIWPRLNCVGLQ